MTAPEPESTLTLVLSYGTIDGGLEMARTAFQRLNHFFAVRRQEDRVMMAATNETRVQVINGPRFTTSLLQRNLVHLLLVERGSQALPTSTLGATGEPWEVLIDATLPANRPKFVVEAWKGSAALWRGGLAEEGYAIRWEKRGYSSHIKSLNACAVGGALDQNRLLIVRARVDLG